MSGNLAGDAVAQINDAPYVVFTKSIQAQGFVMFNLNGFGKIITVSKIKGQDQGLRCAHDLSFIVTCLTYLNSFSFNVFFINAKC